MVIPSSPAKAETGSRRDHLHCHLRSLPTVRCHSVDADQLRISARCGLTRLARARIVVRARATLVRYDIPEVSGKNASLVGVHSTLAERRVRVPKGFALTAQAYRKSCTRRTISRGGAALSRPLGRPDRLSPSSLPVRAMRTHTALRDAFYTIFLVYHLFRGQI